MRVEFRLLGEVEAALDGRRLELGHARQQSVLVALLIDVNRAVRSEQLIERVWSDQPPGNPRNALAAYISRLRQLFSAVEEVQIVRGTGGYALRVPEDAVDLYQFRRLAARARSTANPHEAAEIFDGAVELWRGEPFSAVDTPWGNEVRASLQAERSAVELDRNDAALAAGRHSRLLVTLAATWQGNPLDERVAGQLMMAQYRSGRQADALATYRQTRQRLIDELGVDPGSALEGVYRQILDGEPAPPPIPHAIRTPESQPRRPTRLIGRDRTLAEVAARLADRPLVTLTGVGGVGKSRLAQAVADGAHAGDTTGVSFCELAPLGPGSPVDEAVAATLRVEPRGGLGLDDAIIDYLRPLRLLLVMDNCEHVLSSAAGLVDRVLRHCPDVTILATSREALGVEGEHVMPIRPLDERAAAELFAERARASRPDFDLEQEPAVGQICQHLDGVPLAIELAAARVRMMSTTDVARRLDRLRLLTGGARSAHPRHQSVTATVDWSYRLLSEAERHFFARLSVFAGGFDLDAAHAVCAEVGATEDDTIDLLTGLVDKSMIEVRTGPGATRYQVLEIMRAYGRERLGDSADLTASRHARYFVDYLERAAAGLLGPDEPEWVDAFMPDVSSTFTVPDYGNLRAAFSHAMAAGDHDLALRLVCKVPVLYMRIGVYPAEWADRIVAAADPGHQLYAGAVGASSAIRWYVGDHAGVRALVKPIMGRKAAPGMVFNAYPEDYLALVEFEEGHPHIALSHFRSELERARADRNRMRWIWVLYYLTFCHSVLGEPSAGLPAAREAMEAADGLLNRTGLAMAECALARALAIDEPDRALTHFEHACRLAETVGNNWLSGITRAEAAAIRAVHGDPAVAARMFIEVLDLWDRGGSHAAAYSWDVLHDAARLLYRLGATDEAIVLHHAAVAAGRRPPLKSDQLGSPPVAHAGPMPGPEAIDMVRAALRKYC